MEEKEKALVKNWLSEFKGLPEVAVAAYAERVQEKASVVPALYSAMHDMGTELLEPICHQLFEFIRSGEAALHRFALQFVPELIWRHLSAVARRDKPSQGSVEALLLGIYNLETVDDEGKPKVLSFTVPSLSKSSIYHEPCSIGSLALTEEGLSQRGAGKAVYADSYPQRESITAQNRFEVLTSLLLYYNSAIVFMPLSSYHSLCQLCTRACVSGFPRQRMKRDWKEPHPRVPLLAEFLVQLLEGVYHATYNGAWDMGKRAVEDALYRSKLELYPEPLLLARAIKSSLLQDAPHAGRGRSRCLQLEVTPTSSRISRSVVTSASIRSHRWKKEGISVSPVQADPTFPNGSVSPPNLLLVSEHVTVVLEQDGEPTEPGPEGKRQRSLKKPLDHSEKEANGTSS